MAGLQNVDKRANTGGVVSNIANNEIVTTTEQVLIEIWQVINYRMHRTMLNLLPNFKLCTEMYCIIRNGVNLSNRLSMHATVMILILMYFLQSYTKYYLASIFNTNTH